MRPGKLPSLLVLALLLLLPSVSGARDAAGPTFPRSTWTIELGGFLSDFDTSLRLSGPDGGTRIDLEEALGLDTSDSTFRGKLAWRFADRHALAVGFYDFSRSSRAVIEDSFVIETEDQRLEFDAGAALETEFDWRLFPITYTYSFLQTDRFEAAATAGIHWADVEVAFRGEAVVNGETVADAAERESSSAPLPVLGIGAGYALTERLVLGGQIQYFGLEVDDVSGDLTDIRLTGRYFLTEHLSAGLGYTWYDINYDESRGDFDFNLNYSYEGFEAFVTLHF